jgi:hypothetical protein
MAFRKMLVLAEILLPLWRSVKSFDADFFERVLRLSAFFQPDGPSLHCGTFEHFATMMWRNTRRKGSP